MSTSFNSSPPPDDAEDVNDFLRRIKELGDQREREDLERTRKLEEEIAEGRRLREQRRIERARSISPEKQSPSASPRSLRSSRLDARLDQSLSTEEESRERSKIQLESSRESSPALRASNHKQNLAAAIETPPSLSRPSSGAGVPSRAGTLSWQQRSAGGSRNRPFSMVEKRSPSPASVVAVDHREEPTKSDIAKSLGMKDPTWFRQTAERGQNSAAFRRNREDAEEPTGHGVEKRMLHGLSSANSQIPPESSPVQRFHAPDSPPTAISGTALPLQPSQRFAPSAVESSSEFRVPSGRISPERRERPLSPSKGMGGFVQSAMLARTNSVSKRWSVQPTSGLSRQASDSTAKVDSAKTNEFASDGTAVGMQEKSDATDGKNDGKNDSKTPLVLDAEETTPARNVRPQSRSHSRNESRTEVSTDLTPSSPSKRWSPVKSSWLESALTKPESPRPATPSTVSNQPTWMVQLQKNRQERMSKEANVVPQAKSSLDMSSRSGSPASMPPTQKEDQFGKSDQQGNLAKKSPGARQTSAKPSLTATGKSTPPTGAFVGSSGVGTKPKAVDTSDKQATTGSTPKREVSASKPSPSPKPAALERHGSIKSKPETPPKKEFASTTKTGRTSVDDKKSDGTLEFKNAFGNLRRTQTQKYVAPDELKDNILRGKAGLAITDGPKKTERRDELKESLLQKKEAMKVKAAESKSSHTTPHARAASKDSVVPEAIAKRRTLVKNGSGGSVSSPVSHSSAMSEKSIASEEGIENREPRSTEVSGMRTNVSSKLADRFNPGLAGLLARGPGAAAKPSSSSQDGSEEASHTSFTTQAQDVPVTPKADTSSAGQLQHMTKGRAKGPKRRAPKGLVQDSSPSESRSSPVESLKIAASPKPAIPITSKPKPQSSLPSSPHTTPIKTSSGTSKPVISSSSRAISSSMPDSVAAKSGLNEAPKSTQVLSTQKTVPFTASIDPSPSGSPSLLAAQKQNGRLDPETKEAKQVSPAEPSSTAVRDIKSTWGQKPTLASSTRREPIKLPTQRDEDDAMTNAGLVRNSNFEVKPSVAKTHVDVAPRASPYLAKEGLSKKPLQTYTPSKPAGPKPIGPKPSVANLGDAAPRLTANTEPNTPKLTETGKVLSDFFDVMPVASGSLDVDTQAILDTGKAAGDKIKTLRKTICEIKIDGTLQPMPLEGEHVLFSESLYLCTHIFGSTTGSRTTEVYLWSGNDVSDLTFENAQSVAKKAARDANGTLSCFKQGKEPPNFFRALGDILITRRGSSSDKSNTASTLLCGRKHLGYMAFDEVPFEVSSICSGFPYIAIPESSKSGKVYLWKGTGCNADELGCARLISMDLAPTNEVSEIDEGAESADFMNIFPGNKTTMPRSADHWKLKAKHEKYQPRLFKIDHDIIRPSSRGAGFAESWRQFVRRPSQDDGKPRTKIEEITPFTQRDLEPENIYVLDAFFELYIIVGPLSNNKSRAFASALLFAQEYSIIAASAEDRPNVPFCTIVLEGAPRDMKRVFRHWDDNLVRTELLARGGGLKRSGSLRVMPLSAAVEAVRKRE